MDPLDGCSGSGGLVADAFAALVDAFAGSLVAAEWDTPAVLCAVEMVDVDAAALAVADEEVRRGLSTGERFGFAWALCDPIDVEGHPFDALLGQRMPASAVGAVLAVEGWARPGPGQDPISERLRANAGPDGRAEVRNVVGVLRDGTVAQCQLVRGAGAHHLGGRVAGRVPSALARTVGAPSLLGPQPSPSDVALRSQLFATLVAVRVTASEFADASGFPLSRAGDLVAEAVGLSPMLDGCVPEPLSWLALRCDRSWDSVRSEALEGRAPLAEVIDAARHHPLGRAGFLAPADVTSVIDWCDAELFAHLFDASVPDDDAIDELHESLRADGLLSVPLDVVAGFARTALERRAHRGG